MIRARHLLWIVALIVVGMLLCLGILQSPEYSIYQMFQAAQRHDYATFSRYADTEDVARASMETIFNKSTKDMGNRFKRGSQTEQRFLEIYLTQTKPVLKEDVKYALKHQIETDVFYPEYQPQNLLRALCDIRTNKQGYTATIALLPAGQSNVTLPLNLRLRRIGWHWQVFEIQLQNQEENKDSEKKTL